MCKVRDEPHSTAMKPVVTISINMLTTLLKNYMSEVVYQLIYHSIICPTRGSPAFYTFHECDNTFFLEQLASHVNLFASINQTRSQVVPHGRITTFALTVIDFNTGGTFSY